MLCVLFRHDIALKGLVVPRCQATTTDLTIGVRDLREDAWITPPTYPPTMSNRYRAPSEPYDDLDEEMENELFGDLSARQALHTYHSPRSSLEEAESDSGGPGSAVTPPTPPSRYPLQRSAPGSVTVASPRNSDLGRASSRTSSPSSQSERQSERQSSGTTSLLAGERYPKGSERRRGLV